MNLIEELLDELTNRIIPFWARLKDEKNGGFFGRVTYDLEVREDANKGCILNSRILWFFSKAAAFLKDDSLVSYADHAYNFLVEHCIDKTFGGVFWELDCCGKSIDETKHTYNQAFAIYALSAYYTLTGNKESLATAYSLFDLIENQCRDEQGYLEAFSRQFKPISNEKLSENGVLADRTMNTLLHVFEGYSALYEATANDRIGKALKNIVELFLSKIYNPQKRGQNVFFDFKYTSLIDLTSYGHDIESAWLFDWGCSLIGDKDLLARLRKSLLDMTEEVYAKAYQNQSLKNECENGVQDETRVWWVQAEAMVGFLNAAFLYPDKKHYLEAVSEIWSYINKNMIMPCPNGEWFWDVDIHGEPVSHKDIVEPWKCPYHNGRMCMEIIRRLS